MYESFLISNYETAFQDRQAPWLLPKDAFESLLDSYVYRGVVHKREGYKAFATGGKGGAPRCESRIVRRVTAEAYGAGNGTAGPYLHTTVNTPVRRGTVTITAGAQSAVDNGLGGFTTTPAGGSGTINYTTGQISITFNGAVPGATAITVTYDYHPGLPVMMIANFLTTSNTQQLIVADTSSINRYNTVTNRLDDITVTPFTGNPADFFSWTNYEGELLFTNNVDNLQAYDGTTYADYVYVGLGANLTCLHVFNFKDQLVLLRPTYDPGPTTFPFRIAFTAPFTNDFSAVGGGTIDLDDQSWIFSGSFNRADLMVLTELSTWSLKESGNDVAPFKLDKIDESRGSGAPFGTITYLNQTRSASPLGLTRSDGYNVDRADIPIPDYTQDSIDQSQFDLCYSGIIEKDRDHWLLHPIPLNDADEVDKRSQNILTYNFEEDNFSVYRLPLSTLGKFKTVFELTWADLTAVNGYPNWASLPNNWSAFTFQKGSFFPVGGGQEGQIWQMVEGLDDNPLSIRNITQGLNPTVTTDFHNYKAGDLVSIEDDGTFQYLNPETEIYESIDGQYFEILSVTDNYNFVIDADTTSSPAWGTQVGLAARSIPVRFKTKKFNPYVEENRRVRCGWVYFYATVDEDSVLDIRVITNDNQAAMQSSNLLPGTFFQAFLDGAGVRKWYKVFINVTGNFIQLEISHNIPGTRFDLDAMMFGFSPAERINNG